MNLRTPPPIALKSNSHIPDTSHVPMRFFHTPRLPINYKDLSIDDMALEFTESMSFDSPNQQSVEKLNIPGTPKSILRRGTSFTRQGRLLYDYIIKDPLAYEFSKKKLKCASVDQRSLIQVATTYKSELLIQELKRKVSL